MTDFMTAQPGASERLKLLFRKSIRVSTAGSPQEAPIFSDYRRSNGAILELLEGPPRERLLGLEKLTDLLFQKGEAGKARETTHQAIVNRSVQICIALLVCEDDEIVMKSLELMEKLMETGKVFHGQMNASDANRAVGSLKGRASDVKQSIHRVKRRLLKDSEVDQLLLLLERKHHLIRFAVLRMLGKLQYKDNETLKVVMRRILLLKRSISDTKNRQLLQRFVSEAFDQLGSANAATVLANEREYEKGSRDFNELQRLLDAARACGSDDKLENQRSRVPSYEQSANSSKTKQKDVNRKRKHLEVIGSEDRSSSLCKHQSPPPKRQNTASLPHSSTAEVTERQIIIPPQPIKTDNENGTSQMLEVLPEAVTQARSSSAMKMVPCSSSIQKHRALSTPGSILNVEDNEVAVAVAESSHQMDSLILDQLFSGYARFLAQKNNIENLSQYLSVFEDKPDSLFLNMFIKAQLLLLKMSQQEDRREGTESDVAAAVSSFMLPFFLHFLASEQRKQLLVTLCKDILPGMFHETEVRELLAAMPLLCSFESTFITKAYDGNQPVVKYSVSVSFDNLDSSALDEATRWLQYEIEGVDGETIIGELFSNSLLSNESYDGNPQRMSATITHSTPVSSQVQEFRILIQHPIQKSLCTYIAICKLKPPL